MSSIIDQVRKENAALKKQLAAKTQQASHAIRKSEKLEKALNAAVADHNKALQNYKNNFAEVHAAYQRHMSAASHDVAELAQFLQRLQEQSAEERGSSERKKQYAVARAVAQIKSLGQTEVTKAKAEAAWATAELQKKEKEMAALKKQAAAQKSVQPSPGPGLVPQGHRMTNPFLPAPPQAPVSNSQPSPSAPAPAVLAHAATVPEKCRVSCLYCHSRWWQKECDNGEPCENCWLVGNTECVRPKCESWGKGECSVRGECFRAHEDDGFLNLAGFKKDLKRKLPHKAARESPVAQKKRRLGDGTYLLTRGQK
ncbi:hypothetical protein EJ04DRAFT_529762 [Polyplosphaeria fusca]|uniref:C3H1-type domain-containing protein n=1 Tax=Polyplosphaeria fusca TaxID=682080 RepID=A0A9P4QLF1_9PLEO|nr:hypothetical protein EJ04DRAFT_529762 [Polyplosphaeria fusca]